MLTAQDVIRAKGNAAKGPTKHPVAAIMDVSTSNELNAPLNFEPLVAISQPQ